MLDKLIGDNLKSNIIESVLNYAAKSEDDIEIDLNEIELNFEGYKTVIDGNLSISVNEGE